MLQVVKTQPDAPFRFGLTASRKVGGAVIRNRAKRRLREMVRHISKTYALSGADIVLIARPAAASHPFAAMQNDFLKALRALEVPGV